MSVKFKITNPYESVKELITEKEYHYKTNLHTHSTNLGDIFQYITNHIIIKI